VAFIVSNFGFLFGAGNRSLTGSSPDPYSNKETQETVNVKTFVFMHSHVPIFRHDYSMCLN